MSATTTVEVVLRSSVGDQTERIECSTWRVDRESGALYFNDLGGRPFRAINKRYWLDVTEVRDLNFEA